jgi:hypothetical protein
MRTYCKIIGTLSGYRRLCKITIIGKSKVAIIGITLSQVISIAMLSGYRNNCDTHADSQPPLEYGHFEKVANHCYYHYNC